MKIPLESVIAVVVPFLCLAIPSTVLAQDEDASKAIKAEVFIKQRPATHTPKKNPSAARYRRASRPSSTPNPSTPPSGTTLAQLGVTFWRFRPSTAADKTKELVEEEGEPQEWTLERIEEGTLLLPGQRVRLSIESLSQPGYLYVIDREMYGDGTMGDPILIFPTQKTRGANYVKAGRLIYIPSPTGKFTIKPSEGPKIHVGEVVTIVVSSNRLIDPDQLSAKSTKLPREQVESWEKLWGTTTTRFEMDGGVGQPMTAKEQAAGAIDSQELTQEDPPPQTVYRLAVKSNNPIVLSVPLKFRN